MSCNWVSSLWGTRYIDSRKLENSTDMNLICRNSPKFNRVLTPTRSKVIQSRKRIRFRTQYCSYNTEAELQDIVRELVGEEIRVTEVSDLSRGYCNTVHLVTVDGDVDVLTSATTSLSAVQSEDSLSTDSVFSPCSPSAKSSQVVVKTYSDISRLRVLEAHRGVPDVLASQQGLAPRVVSSTHHGIVHEFLSGSTLTEEMVHRPGHPDLIQSAAARMAHFHSLPIEPPYSPNPLIWHWLDTMLHAASSSMTPLPSFVTLPQLQEEIRFIKDALTSVSAEVVFAHGDLKPSNMMLCNHEDLFSDKSFSKKRETDNIIVAPADLMFIDLELSGPNYRGFDIMKFFRADERFSETNMRTFLASYLEEICSLSPGSNSCIGNVEQLYAEARMFEPLTWLEAAVFFVLVLTIQEVDENHERNSILGKQRWEKYLSTKWMIDKYFSQAGQH